MKKSTKKEIGRPSKLTPQMLALAMDYLVFRHKEVEDIVPSVAGLAIFLGVNKTTLYEFCKVDSQLGRDFSNTLESIKEKQEKMLINGGLSGGYNATITKLMLANHGYHERQEVTHIEKESPKTLNDFYSDENGEEAPKS